MIVSLTVRNFKSMIDMTMKFRKFTCLVGLNGAGKSGVLQAIDFVSHIMEGDVDYWLARRQWDVQDLHSKLTTASNIVIFMVYKLKSGRVLRWRAVFNRKTRSCTREEIIDVHTEEELFAVRRGHYSVGGGETSDIDVDYQGSLLSRLKEKTLTEDLITLRNEIRNIRSLELLSPHLMRGSSRESESDIGAGGEKLSAYLYSIKGDERVQLLNMLKIFYPSVTDFKIKQQRAGWKRLFVIEEFDGKRIETEAKHINDGLLRVIAILAQSYSTRSVLLFDEIENGINPEIVEKLVDILQECPQQIIVSTHSPLILNYLSDTVAAKSVQFVYRSISGGTRVRPLFGVARLQEKLEYMGAGEVFADTSLSLLTKECRDLDKSELGAADQEGE